MNWVENVERAGILMMLKFLKTRLVESTQRNHWPKLHSWTNHKGTAQLQVF